MTQLVLSTNQSSAGSATEVVWSTPSAYNLDPGRVPSAMPAFISAEEAYFWSFTWQEGVRESMAALRAGDSRLFDSDDPGDVVRWLLSDND